MLLSTSPAYLGVCSCFHCARLLLGACSRDARGELETLVHTALLCKMCLGDPAEHRSTLLVSRYVSGWKVAEVVLLGSHRI